MARVTDPQPLAPTEDGLRGYYARLDPGPAPSGYVSRMEAELVTASARPVATPVRRGASRSTIPRFGLVATAVVVAAALAIAFAAGDRRAASVASPSSDLASPVASAIVANQPSAFPSDPTAIAYFNAADGLVAGNIHNNAAVWRTMNDGVTWTVASLDVARSTDLVINGSHAWAVGGSIGSRLGPALFESADLGRSWVKVSPEALTSISFGDEEHGFALRRTPEFYSSIVRSADGGYTWNPVPAAMPCGTPTTAGDPRAVGISFVSAVHGWVLCERYVGGSFPVEQRMVMETTDAGATWEAVSVVGPLDPRDDMTLATSDLPMDIEMHADGSGLIWCLGGSLLQTLDAGKTWRNVSTTPLTSTPQPWIIGSEAATGAWLGVRPDVLPLAIQWSDDTGSNWSTVAAELHPTPTESQSLPHGGEPPETTLRPETTE